MSRSTTLFLSALFCLLFSQLAGAQPDIITILHVNDTHSNLEGTGPRDASLKTTKGGIARAASLIGSIKQSNPDAVLLHAGDLFIGDLFFIKYFGVPELQIMQQLGFDAMTVGNHEFDLTPSTLLQALQTAFPAGGFPLLSANISMEDSTVSGLKNFIQPSTIITRGTHKIGIFGLTTPSTNYFSLPAPVVVSEDLPQIAAAEVASLQQQGCDVIILLSHLGMNLDKVIAANIPGIHAIIGGHDHRITQQPVIVQNPEGKPVVIVQVGSFYSGLGRLDLSIDNGNVALSAFQYIPIDENIPEYPDVKAVVDGLKADFESVYGPMFSQQVATVDADFEEELTDLSGTGSTKTAVGCLVTKSLRQATGTDIAITVGGATAQKLWKGPITGADVFRMISYGFNTTDGLGYHIATFDMTGTALYAALEYTLSDLSSDELFAQTAGLEFTFDASAAPYSRIQSITVLGQPLDPTHTYSVTSNQFIVEFINFLHLMEPTIEISNVNVLGDVTEFSAVMNYIVPLGNISPDCSPVTGVGYPGVVPASFRMEQNYPNPFGATSDASNASTFIPFTLDRNGFFELKVWNSLGQVVATVVSGEMEAGDHTVPFDAAILPSGVYYYKLSSEGRSTTKRMILLR